MKKFKVIFIAVLVLTAAIFIYFYSFSYKCEYSDRIRSNDNVIVKDFSGASASEKQLPSCEVPVTSCRGLTCIAPIMHIQCGTSIDICGQPIKCECVNL